MPGRLRWSAPSCSTKVGRSDEAGLDAALRRPIAQCDGQMRLADSQGAYIALARLRAVSGRLHAVRDKMYRSRTAVYSAISLGPRVSAASSRTPGHGWPQVSFLSGDAQSAKAHSTSPWCLASVKPTLPDCFLAGVEAAEQPDSQLRNRGRLMGQEIYPHQLLGRST